MRRYPDRATRAEPAAQGRRDRPVRVVFVNRFFYPDLAPTGQLAADVAFDLAAHGREVHAVTSRLSYDAPGRALAADETVRGVRVHRVWTTRFGRGTLPGRALDYASFYVSATLKLLALLRAGDVVVAKTDPPLVSACAAFAAWVRRARLVNWQQDIFPEAAVELGFGSLAGVLGCPIRMARNWSLRRAAANVALGERMAARLRGIVPRAPVHVIHNWADGARVRPIREMGRDGRFVAGYSGNMGRAHELETILEACLRLKDEPAFAFVFTGGGQKRAQIEEAVRRHGLSNVELRPYVEEEHLAESLGACDVHLVSLLPRLVGLIVPSKFYGVAAAGRPAIFVGDPDGEIARLLRRHEIGISVRPGDVEGLVTAIQSLRKDEAGRLAMGARARKAFEAQWDKPIALAKWRALIEDVTQGHRRLPASDSSRY